MNKFIIILSSCIVLFSCGRDREEGEWHDENVKIEKRTGTGTSTLCDINTPINSLDFENMCEFQDVILNILNNECEITSNHGLCSIVPEPSCDVYNDFDYENGYFTFSYHHMANPSLGVNFSNMYQLSSIKLSQWCTYNYNPIDDARECDYYDPSLITLDDCEDGNPTFGWTLTPQEISKFYADVKNLTETFLLRFVDYDCCQMQVVDIDFYVGYYNLCSEPCVEECGTFPNIYYSINTNCGIGIFPKVKLACCPIY